MRAAVVGPGAVGGRVARALAADPLFDSVTVLHREPDRVPLLGDGRILHRKVPPFPRVDVTVVAVASGERRTVSAALAAGSHVVCVIDDPVDVRALLSLDPEARRKGSSVVVGAAMAPGLSCLIASKVARRFERVEEIHVASLGTGGPACARRHHAALASIATDWEDGEWRRRPAGSGRELVWFPEPVGGADCYRAALADPVLLVPAFPGCRRITSRLEATRRDRLTSWLPMLRPPHPEGLVGAVRVEVRGWSGGRAVTEIVGTAIAPAVAAAAVASRAAHWAAAGQLARTGAGGLASMVTSPGRMIRELAAEGVHLSEFAGAHEEGD